MTPFAAIRAAWLLLLLGAWRLNADVPAGFTALFNGHDLTGWKADAVTARHWFATNGILRHDGVTNDLWTVREYGDFTLRLDWRWPDPPHWEDHPVFGADGDELKDATGKTVTKHVLDGGDSGVFLRGFPKAQVNLLCYPCGSGEVWEYRTDTSLPRAIRAALNPRKQADKPVGEWNQMEIALIGDRLTVSLNGEEVISHAQLPGIPPRGPIGLQHEFGAVEFRNLHIRELASPSSPQPAGALVSPSPLNRERAGVRGGNADTASSPPQAPTTASSLPQPRPGWRIEQILGAPTLRHPSVVCTAPDGRVFVAEDPMDISTPRADATEGRILCWHPDGHVTVFAEQLHAVFGLQYLEGRLYVLHNPQFSVFRDENGIGRDRMELIESTNPNPWALEWNDHVPSNFHLGLDGYFYGATGDKGLYRARGRDGREVSMRGGIWRIRPDGTGLEVFATGVRNILDVALSEEDDLFTYDNTDEHQWMSRLTHMVDGGTYGWPHDFIPRRPYTLWMMADYGAGAATGALCYDDDALPAAYRGNLFLSDFGKRQILRIPVARAGATFRAGEREDLFPNPPADFRPVGICESVDGRSLFICDWQHRDEKDANPERKGRLLRLTWAGADESAPRPGWFIAAASGKPFTASDAELIAALSHPVRLVRLTAQRRLAERGTKTKNALLALLTDMHAASLVRIHALWALQAIHDTQSTRAAVLAAVKDPDPVVARQAMRRLATPDHAANPTGTSPLPHLTPALSPPSGRAEGESRSASTVLVPQLRSLDASRRFAAATALGRLASPMAVEALRNTLADEDSWVRYAAFTALNRIGRAHAEAWPSIVTGIAEARPQVREATGFSLRETYAPALVESLAAFVTQHPSLPTPFPLLGELYRKHPDWDGNWWAYHPADAPPPAKSLTWAGSSRIGQVLSNGLAATSPEVRLAAVQAVQTARITELRTRLEALSVIDPDTATRMAAFSALAEFGEVSSLSLFTRVLADADAPEALRLKAVAGLVRTKAGSAAGPLRQLAQQTQVSPPLLAATLSALGDLKATEAIPDLAQQLHHPDAAVNQAASVALAGFGTDEALAALLKAAKDAAIPVRQVVIPTLGRFPQAAARTALLQAATKSDTATEAIAALASRPHLEALDAYLDGLARPSATLREQCRKALTTLRTNAWPVLEPRLEKLDAVVIAQLQLVFAEHAAAKSSPLFTRRDSLPLIGDYLAAARGDGGDPEHGRAMFRNAGGLACIRCHRVAGEGADIGPDLTGIGTQFDRMALAEAILFPSQTVREGYQQTMLELANGESISGILKAESADDLTLRDAEGRTHRLAKSEIKERFASDLSLMPEGLQAGLSLDAWRDLLAYLGSLK